MTKIKVNLSDPGDKNTITGYWTYNGKRIERKCKLHVEDGYIFCVCGKCQPEDYPLPEDFFNLDLLTK